MANQKEYKIIINGINESIEGIGTLQDSLDRLSKKVEESGGSMKTASKSMDELAKAEQKIAEYNEEYQRALAADKAVLADKNKAIKDSIDLEKANITVQENAQGTYAEKQQLLTALGKVIKNTNAETEEEIQKQNELKAQYASLNQELKDFDASLGNHQRNVGDYGQATKNLKTELKELQAEMATMLSEGVDKADPKFVQLAQKAGQMKDAIQDAGEEIKRFASDTKKIDDVINIAQSATAAFELYKGTMSAFGLETEAAEQAIQKLAGAMSIIQSLQTLSNTLQEGSATAKLFHAALKLTGAELIVNQVNSIKATAAQEGLTAAQKAGTIATKALSLAIKAIPLMFIIGLVTELILHWEDLVGWFNKTFPILKKLGGAMNALKAVFAGVGNAIINWVINPIKTLANVVQKIFEGDFKGAIDAVGEGIRNQFIGTAKAFKTGFQDQVEKGLEDISKKTAEEAAKQTKYELDMLKARKGNQAKYSKEGIALQKKEFEERKKAAKGNAEELKQIALDEANFERECEEAKAAAAEKSAAARTRANKAAADAARKAAEEERRKREEEEKKRKETIDATVSLMLADAKTQKLVNKERQREIELVLDRYSTGPLEKYIAAYKELLDLEEKEAGLSAYEGMMSVVYEMKKEFPKLVETTAEGLEKLGKQANEASDDYAAFYVKLRGEIGLTEIEAKKYLTLLTQYKNAAIETDNAIVEARRKAAKEIASARKGEIDSLTSDADRIFKELLEKVKEFNTDPVLKKNIWGKWFGAVDEKKTIKKLDYIKEHWKEALTQINGIIDQEQFKWDAYLEALKDLYGEDSRQYKKGVEEKIDALKKLYDMQEKVASRALTPTSRGINYGGTDDKVSLNNLSPINKKQSKTKQDSRNGGMGTDSTNWEALWDPEGEVWSNIAKLSDVMFENVFDPIAEGFSALLEFEIEEAQEALDQATEMHEKSVEAVEASQNRISELNDKMRNSSGAQLEAYKQQQADEMLLLAQREAEEKRLAREKEKREKELAKKQKQQRKLELQMQLVEGLVNTAVGVTKALTWGFPLGVVFAAIIGAMGALQTAIIAKQISKLADGGLLSGKSHSQGGIPVGNTGIEVEGGEYVVNKRSTAKYLPLLQAINEEGARKKTVANQLGKYASGGQLNYERIDSNMNSVDTNKVIQSSIEQIDMHPQVSVVDINRGQKNLTTVRQMAGARV